MPFLEIMLYFYMINLLFFLGKGHFVSPLFYELPENNFFTISWHEQKDMVFGTEFVNEIQQKYMVFGMKSVQEFGIDFQNSFFNDYNHWKRYFKNWFRTPCKFFPLRTSKFAWSSETESLDVRNDKERETVIEKRHDFRKYVQVCSPVRECEVVHCKKSC